MRLSVGVCVTECVFLFYICDTYDDNTGAESVRAD